jgi:hypothetical protein
MVATGHDRTEALAVRFREAFSCFDRYARQAFASAFGSVAHFAAQHRMKVRISDVVPDRRSFQFVMDDDSRLTISFALEGIDRLECSAEYWMPGLGRVDGLRSTTSLREADRRWGEACLLMALDGFVIRCLGNRCRQQVRSSTVARRTAGSSSDLQKSQHTAS